MVGRIATRVGMSNVLPAFFALLRPNIQDQIAELASRGIDRIVIMPYFLFQGQHVGIDIPNILAQCHEWFPHVTLELMPTLGTIRPWKQSSSSGSCRWRRMKRRRTRIGKRRAGEIRRENDRKMCDRKMRRV